VNVRSVHRSLSRMPWDCDATVELQVNDDMVCRRPCTQQKVAAIVYQLYQFSEVDRVPISILFQENNCFRFKPRVFAENYVPLHYIVTFSSLVTLQNKHVKWSGYFCTLFSIRCCSYKPNL